MGGIDGNNLVLPVIGSQQSIDTDKSIDKNVKLDSRNSMPSSIRPNL